MFKKGERVTIEKEINVIPAGCYKFLGRNNEMLFFSVGSSATFGATENAAKLMKRTPHDTLTHPDEFLTKYYDRLMSIREETTGTSPFKTLCSVNPTHPLVKELESKWSKQEMH